MDDGASKEGRSVPLAQACRSPACELLAAKLGKSEQKRQRLRANLQKFREKLIDTNKLLELFNEVKQEKELAERQLAPLAAAARELETVRRQQTEDRRKLEEARDQLADKAREVKDLDAINARLRTKNDASVAEGTQRVTRELERCKKDKHAAQQAKELAERRARQADSRLKTEQALVAELRKQLETARAEPSDAGSAAAGSRLGDAAASFHPAQLNDMTAAISAQLRESVQQMVRTEVNKAAQSSPRAPVSSPVAVTPATTSQVDALRTTMEGRFEDLAAVVRTSAGTSPVEAGGREQGATAELLQEMRWIRRRVTQGLPHISDVGVPEELAAIADAPADSPANHAPTDGAGGVRERRPEWHTQEGEYEQEQEGRQAAKEEREAENWGGDERLQQRDNERNEGVEEMDQEKEGEQQEEQEETEQLLEEQEADAASFALELEEALSPDTGPGPELDARGSSNAVPSDEGSSSYNAARRDASEAATVGDCPANESQHETDTSRLPQRHRSSPAHVESTSSTVRPMDREEFETQLKHFYDPKKVPAPIMCGQRIDFFLLYQLVMEFGGPDETGKQRKWATIGRKLVHSTGERSSVVIPSSVGNNAKSNYSKYISPAIEHKQHLPEAGRSRTCSESEFRQSGSRKREETELEQARSSKRARVAPVQTASVVAPEVSSLAKLWNSVATSSVPDSRKKLEIALAQCAGRFVQGSTQNYLPESRGQGQEQRRLTELMKLSGRLAANRHGSKTECGCNDSSKPVCSGVEQCLVAAAGPVLQTLRSWCEAMVVATSAPDRPGRSFQYAAEAFAGVWCDAITNLANTRWTSSDHHATASKVLLSIEETPSGVACAFLALVCHLLDHSGSTTYRPPTAAAGLSAALLTCLRRRLLCFEHGREEEEVLARHFGYAFGVLCKLRGAMETGRVCLYELLRYRAGLELGVIDAICAGWPQLGPIDTRGRTDTAGTSAGDYATAGKHAHGSRWWLRRTMAWALTCQCADLALGENDHGGRPEQDDLDLNSTTVTRARARHYWKRLRPTWDPSSASALASNGGTDSRFLNDLLRAALDAEPAEPAEPIERTGVLDAASDLRLSAGLAGRVKDWVWIYENWVRPTLLPLATRGVQDAKQSKPLQSAPLAQSAKDSSSEEPNSTRPSQHLNAIRLLGDLVVVVGETAARLPTTTVQEQARKDVALATSGVLPTPPLSCVHARSVSAAIGVYHLCGSSYERVSSPHELVAVIVGVLAERVSTARPCIRVSAAVAAADTDRLTTAGCQCGGGCSDAPTCAMATAARDALSRISDHL